MNVRAPQSRILMGNSGLNPWLERAYLSNPLPYPLSDRELFKPRRIGGNVCFLTSQTPFIQRPQRPHSSLSAAPSIRARCLTLTSTITPATTPPPPLVRSLMGINSWTRHQPFKMSATRGTAILSQISGVPSSSQGSLRTQQQLSHPRSATVSIVITFSPTSILLLGLQSHRLWPPRISTKPMGIVSHHTLSTIGRRLTGRPKPTPPAPRARTFPPPA